MTDRLYTSATEIEKARALCERGVLLADRTEGFHRMELYQLKNYYLEITLHIHFNVVTKVSSFTDCGKLDPYLQEISIDELF